VSSTPVRRGPGPRDGLVALAVVAVLAALIALGRFAPDGGPAASPRPATDGRTGEPAYERLSGRVMADRPGSRRVGADISWPECRRTEGIPGKRGQGKPMPPRTSRFVVLGLTNGPAFHPNPCLARQVAWVKRHRMYAAAYAVTTYPFPREVRRYGSVGPFSDAGPDGRLANVGYRQARANLDTMRDAGLTSPVVWIDVEDSSLRVWPRTPGRNRRVVEGLLRGYRQAGLLVGFYSTPSIWGEILGDASYGLPEWRSAGETSQAAARGRCTSGSIQGGPAVLAQWWIPAKDFDITCPGYASPRAMRTWFHRY
jgi:hypothetical protein